MEPVMDGMEMTLAAALEQAADVIMVTDLSGVIRYVNPVFERVSGYTRAEAIGGHARMLKSGKHDPAFYRSLWETLSHGRTWRGTFVNRRKDGGLYQEAAVISPVRDAAGRMTGYLAVKRDATLNRRPAFHSRRVRTLEAIGRLAGGAAHDFNNALMTIMGTMEMLDAHLPATEECRDAVTDIRAACDRATSLTRQLSALGRSQRRQLVTLDVNGVVAGAEKMLRRLLGEEVRLVIQRSPVPALARFDVSRIERILMRLAMRAWELMPTGSTLIVAVSIVDAGAPGGRADGAVDDAGAFVQLSVAGTCAAADLDGETWADGDAALASAALEPGEATLLFGDVRDLIHQSGGRMTFQRNAGGGTTFTVILPRVASGDAGPAPGVRTVEALSGSETVLVAEDEGAVRDLVRLALSRLGYRVLDAPDGPTAMRVAAVHGGRIDVLITDIVMPGMSGHELADRVVALHPSVKVIYMSGYANGIVGGRGVFLPKPFSGERLARVVREAIGRT